MQRIQFYPSEELATLLGQEAKQKGVSISTFLTDLLNNYYGLTQQDDSNITKLTATVLQEVEEYIKTTTPNEFDLNSASETYRSIKMTNGKKPSTVRASIGRSFSKKIGKPPFANVRPCIINGKNKLSVNNALVYETFYDRQMTAEEPSTK